MFFFFITSKAKTAQPMHIMPVIMSHARARVVAAGRRRRFFLLQEGKTPKGEFLIRKTWLEKLRVSIQEVSPAIEKTRRFVSADLTEHHEVIIINAYVAESKGSKEHQKKQKFCWNTL